MSGETPEVRSPETVRQELLVVRCQLGEREAFDELAERWHLPIWRYVRRLLGRDEEAEEVTQKVWLRILPGIRELMARRVELGASWRADPQSRPARVRASTAKAVVSSSEP